MLERMRIGHYLLITILCGLAFAAKGPATELSRKPADVDALLARLEAQIPIEPAGTSPELNALINEAGATKRLDAALLLIRALSVSFSPVGENEHRTPFALMPAAEALQRDFGSSALPLLMFSGVTTDKAWLQTRIALAMRGIGSEAEIRDVRQAFSVNEQSNPTARKFDARLAEPKLRLADDPVLSLAEQIEKMIVDVLEKQRQEKERKPPGSVN
jgi:hypothetical protein